MDNIRYLCPKAKDERTLFQATSFHVFDWQRHLNAMFREHGVHILVDRRGREDVPLPAHAVDLDMATNPLCRVLTHEHQRSFESPEQLLSLFSTGVITVGGDGDAVFFCQPSSRTRPENTHFCTHVVYNR